MKHRIACLFLILLSGLLNAQPTEINGKTPFPGTLKVEWLTISDYLTNTHEVWATDTLRNGKFTLLANLPQTVYTLIRIEGQDYALYAEPGKFYDVEIVDYGYPLSFNNIQDTNELNFAIGRFDYEYGNFTADNYESFLSGTIRPYAKAFADSMNVKYAFIQNPFLQDYIHYKLGTLLLASKAIGNTKTYENYFANRPVQFYHGEYMYFLTLFYANTLTDNALMGKGKNTLRALKNGTGFDSVLADVIRAPFCGDTLLSQTVALYGLYKAYYMPMFEKPLVENVIREALQTCSHPAVRKIAENMLATLGRMNAGKDAPELVGRDIEGNQHALSEFAGKVIYLSFFDISDASSIAEASNTNALYTKYKKDVVFVHVTAGATYSTLSDFIKRNGFKWNFWIVDEEMLNQYEINALPAFYLIDKEGKLVESPAKSPSQGIDTYLYDLTKKVKGNR